MPPGGGDGDVDGARRPAGAVAVIWVAEIDGEAGAAVAPKSTAVAPVKPVPVMVTDGAAGGRPAGRG